MSHYDAEIATFGALVDALVYALSNPQPVSSLTDYQRQNLETVIPLLQAAKALAEKVGADTTGLESRMDAVEARVAAAEQVNTEQNARLTSVEQENASQNARLNALENPGA